MKICVLGAGAYGIALSSIFNKNKHNTIIWTHSKEEEKELKDKKVSPKLKEYTIPSNIRITTNLKSAVKNSTLVVIAVPAHAVNTCAIELSKYLTKDMHILLATKGIENDTCAFLTDVLERHINTNKIGVISGPSFAKDIVGDAQVGLSLATTNSRTKNIIKEALENENIKLRVTLDIIGVQVCGAIKNVMAIASGMLDGMKVPDSTKALFLTEALNDIKELIEALGGDRKTILSYAGFGDILMTCTSENSRNFTYGKLIGQGKLKETDKYAASTTVEGIYTLKSIKELIKRENVKMEVIDLISDIICKNRKKEEILTFLIKKK